MTLKLTTVHVRYENYIKYNFLIDVSFFPLDVCQKEEERPVKSSPKPNKNFPKLCCFDGFDKPETTSTVKEKALRQEQSSAPTFCLMPSLTINGRSIETATQIHQDSTGKRYNNFAQMWRSFLMNMKGQIRDASQRTLVSMQLPDCTLIVVLWEIEMQFFFFFQESRLL